MKLEPELHICGSSSVFVSLKCLQLLSHMQLLTYVKITLCSHFGRTHNLDSILIF
jgi:hypothetical protein